MGSLIYTFTIRHLVKLKQMQLEYQWLRILRKTSKHTNKTKKTQEWSDKRIKKKIDYGS